MLNTKLVIDNIVYNFRVGTKKLAILFENSLDTSFTPHPDVIEINLNSNQYVQEALANVLNDLPSDCCGIGLDLHPEVLHITLLLKK